MLTSFSFCNKDKKILALLAATFPGLRTESFKKEKVLLEKKAILSFVLTYLNAQERYTADKRDQTMHG